jgi:hypothetical protein
MTWDKDANGNLTAVPLQAFEVAAFPEDQLVLVRVEVGGTQIQMALGAEYATALAMDLRDASEQVLREAANRQPH